MALREQTTQSGKESMVEYLRRVGDDNYESGKDFTAQEYYMAADRIEHLEVNQDAYKAQLEAVEAAYKELYNALEAGRKASKTWNLNSMMLVRQRINTQGH